MPDKDLYPGEGSLTAQDLAAIRDALVEAYPQHDFFYMRMADKWGIRVQDDITAVDTLGFRPIVQRIAEFARSEGRLLDLLALAWSDKPDNGKLELLADKWLPDQEGVRAKYGDTAAEPPPAQPFTQAQLQKQVQKHSRLVSLHDFVANMELLASALCRVGIPAVNGTGFLIGRRTVLTNYHVVQKAIETKQIGENITCEFDYWGDGAAPVTFKGRSGAGWLGPKSPYSLSDISGSGQPEEGQLDFAVIHLASDVEPTRRPLELPFAPPVVSQNDYVVIGQHPKGQAAQLALGQVIAHPGESLRYRYNVTTESGSSGSPVLDMDLRLVALHHAAEPTSDPKYNQGVPIARVKEAIAAAGVDMQSL